MIPPLHRDEFAIRDYESRDRAGAYDVCLKTGDAGLDATSLHTDPEALGNIYVGPYLEFEPSLALMLDHGGCVNGYCLAAFDTRKFFDRFLREWLPPLRDAHEEPAGEPSTWSATEQIYHEYHHPDLSHPEPLEDYPSHLHIDLLPFAQGKGWGRRLIERLTSRLEQRGSPGVYLGMWARNHRALQFYSKLGFTELARMGEGDRATLYLGLRLRPR